MKHAAHLAKSTHSPPLSYFRVCYSYPGGTAHTVTLASHGAAAWRTFQRDNPHVTVTSVEDEHGRRDRKESL